MRLLVINIQKRLLNSSKVEDYFFVSFISLFPVILSRFIPIWEHIDIGINQDKNQRTGYEDALNHISLIVILPISLFLLRKFADYLFGVNIGEHQQDKVPILTLFENQVVRDEIHKKLKKTALNPIMPCVIFALDILFHCFDIGEIIKQYFQTFLNQIPDIIPKEIYWGNLSLAKLQNWYVVRGKNDIHIDVGTNFLFTITVYLGQFVIFFIAITAITLILRHNVFYLNLVYQRNRVSSDRIPYHIVLNFDDRNYRFGQSNLNFIFNLQLFSLFSGGIFVLCSRLVITKRIPFKVGRYFDFFQQNLQQLLANLFPEFGQYVIVILWLFTFAVVLLPSFVKFLPLFSRKVASKGWSIEDYLREFIPPQNDRKYPLNTTAQINNLASKFAWNSFWPSGDDIARWIFYFVFFVCLIILFPLNWISTVIYAVIALFLSESFLNIYRWGLGHVDERLVKRTLETRHGDIIMGNQFNQSGNIGIGYNEGTIQGEAKVVGVVNEAKQQSLVTAAQEIQQLLKELSQTYPTKTTSDQMIVAAEAIKRIESDPSLKQRILSAAKEGGLSAFEKTLDNPLGAFITGAIKGWLEP
jgi:hypothetical protein